MLRETLTSDQLLWETYERASRSLLWRLQPRHLQHGVNRLRDEARALVAEGMPCDEALAHVYRRACHETLREMARTDPQGRCPTGAASEQPRGTASQRMGLERERHLKHPPVPESPDFQCDAALGGLARWLRAAGYDARWWPGISDDRLVRETLSSSAILLTTDRPLCRRGVVAYGVIPALLVPVSLKKLEQFAFVVGQLQLPLKPPRCMKCAGRLCPVPKLKVRDRIPPRTYPWRDDYFVCDRCDKLYWRGTHWRHIGDQLRQAVED
jgi:uncharacterized protein with PIN domain